MNEPTTGHARCLAGWASAACMAWAGRTRRVAAAAVLMMGMRRMAVDGLDGGDVAGHDQLRVGEGWKEVRSLKTT